MKVKPDFEIRRVLQDIRDLAAAFLRGLRQVDFVLAVRKVIGENVC